MWAVSDAFLAEIRKSHTMVAYADVTTPTGQSIRLTVVDGTITIDRTQTFRRSASLTVIDPTGALTPVDSTSPLAPFGSTVRPYRGVRYATGPLAGSTEVVPLGVFRISQSTVSRTATGQPSIDLECYDLSRTIERDEFGSPYTIPAGTSVTTAAKQLVTRTFPGQEFDATSSTAVLNSPLTFDTDEGPWSTANNELATAVGMEMFFTADGLVKVAPPSDIDNLPASVFTFIEGPGCTLIEADLVLSDDPGYNGVVLTTDAAGDETAPLRSIQWDTEPTSPTYYKGPYGKCPYFVTVSGITTQTQADNAAIAQLNLILGVSSQLNVTSTVNPALDANDTISVANDALGINAKYTIDSLTIPMAISGTSSILMRAKRSS